MKIKCSVCGKVATNASPADLLLWDMFEENQLDCESNMKERILCPTCREYPLVVTLTRSELMRVREEFHLVVTSITCIPDQPDRLEIDPLVRVRLDEDHSIQRVSLIEMLDWDPAETPVQYVRVQLPRIKALIQTASDRNRKQLEAVRDCLQRGTAKWVTGYAKLCAFLDEMEGNKGDDYEAHHDD